MGYDFRQISNTIQISNPSCFFLSVRILFLVTYYIIAWCFWVCVFDIIKMKGGTGSREDERFGNARSGKKDGEGERCERLFF